MKIDRPHVSVVTLEPTSKKFLVRPCATDKIKDKNIVWGSSYAKYVTQSGYSEGFEQKKDWRHWGASMIGHSITVTYPAYVRRSRY